MSQWGNSGSNKVFYEKIFWFGYHIKTFMPTCLPNRTRASEKINGNDEMRSCFRFYFTSGENTFPRALLKASSCSTCSYNTSCILYTYFSFWTGHCSPFFHIPVHGGGCIRNKTHGAKYRDEIKGSTERMGLQHVESLSLPRKKLGQMRSVWKEKEQ